MKYFRRLIIVLIIGCLSFSFLEESKTPTWQGETSAVMRSFYNLKKAEAVNSKKLTVYTDDEKVLEDKHLEHLFMGENLEVMAAPEAVARIFGYTVEAIEETIYTVSNGEKTYIFEHGSDVVRESSDTFNFEKPMQMRGEKMYISLHAICMAFEQGYRFSEEENSVYIVKTDKQEDALPEMYDMRTAARVPDVESQGNYGTCWAFASLSALESALMPEEKLKFSVDHLSMNNGFNISQNEGGDYLIALSYLASWKGPVYEADDPYGDGQTDTVLTPVKHLQGAVNVAAKDYEAIKRMVYSHGGVQSSFYSDIEVSNVSSEYYNMNTAAYYYDGEMTANHDIVIVGWDDTFPKEKFNKQPSNDGAFLCQNSWGSSFGNDGYFYISYEDTNIGNNNFVYTRIDEPDNYQYMYQSDSLGWLGGIGYNDASAWFANVYTATGFQTLKAVSFYTTGANTTYEVYVVPSYENEDSFKDAVFLKSGYAADSGYYTVDFAREFPISGDFAIVVFVRTPEAIHPVAIEYRTEQIDADVDIDDGRGYISYDGAEWQRAEENYDCNICLKAFTNDIN